MRIVKCMSFWLQEELIRARSDVYSSVGSKNGHFKGRNVRDSLNQLRVSLNRSLIVPNIDNDLEEEVNVGEDDIKELHQQLQNLHSSCEENLRDPSDKRGSNQSSSIEESCEAADLLSADEFNSAEEMEMEEFHDSVTSTGEPPYITNTSRASDIRNSIAISSCIHSSILEEPTLSESPKIRDTLRKSIVTTSTLLSSQNNILESSKSLKRSENLRSSLRSSKVFPNPTESLAASLQRGLQIIDHHQKNSGSDKPSLSFSFEHLTLKPCPESDKVNASVQTSNSPATALLCLSCRQKIDNNTDEIEDGLKAQMVAVDEAEVC